MAMIRTRIKKVSVQSFSAIATGPMTAISFIVMQNEPGIDRATNNLFCGSYRIISRGINYELFNFFSLCRTGRPPTVKYK